MENALFLAEAAPWFGWLMTDTVWEANRRAIDGV